MRKNAFAFCGGAFGDEGKGRIVDEYVGKYAKKGKVIVYRDNGGANAGHTIEFADGRRIAFHQLPSGVFNRKATIILGKGMVIHPGDLLKEITDMTAIAGVSGVAKIIVDEMAALSLDTHRAFESALKLWHEGGKPATGRGISPAYADILLRHPLRVRDILHFNLEAVQKHYRLYNALLKGLGPDLATVKVPALGTDMTEVGSEQEFIRRLQKQAKSLTPYIAAVATILSKLWHDEKITFIFEKAQAVGLDTRWGVYPDVTASDTTFDGIYSASEGVIDPADISVRAGVIKATYMSSVGTRVLPTVMEETLAAKIREDAHEYGATTKRPRGICYLDIPALEFFCRVGNINALVLTHMDVVYPNTPIKICVGYTLKGKSVPYRPDQEYLLTVKPRYVSLPVWDQKQIQQAKRYAQLPREAKQFLKFVSTTLHTRVLMITTGPKRDQSIYMPKD